MFVASLSTVAGCAFVISTMHSSLRWCTDRMPVIGGSQNPHAQVWSYPERKKNSFVGNAYSQYLYLIGADNATNAEMVAVYIVFSYYISEHLKMW